MISLRDRAICAEDTPYNYIMGSFAGVSRRPLIIQVTRRYCTGLMSSRTRWHVHRHRVRMSKRGGGVVPSVHVWTLTGNHRWLLGSNHVSCWLTCMWCSGCRHEGRTLRRIYTDLLLDDSSEALFRLLIVCLTGVTHQPCMQWGTI